MGCFCETTMVIIKWVKEGMQTTWCKNVSAHFSKNK